MAVSVVQNVNGNPIRRAVGFVVHANILKTFSAAAARGGIPSNPAGAARVVAINGTGPPVFAAPSGHCMKIGTREMNRYRSSVDHRPGLVPHCRCPFASQGKPFVKLLTFPAFRNTKSFRGLLKIEIQCDQSATGVPFDRRESAPAMNQGQASITQA